jgi:hypothetical protein
MRSLLLYWLLTLSSFVDAVFSTGGFAIGGEPRQTWVIGTPKVVTYTTAMTEYTIALWQHTPEKAQGNMAKVLFGT